MAEFEFYTNFNLTQSSILIKLFLWKFFITAIFPILIKSKIIFDNQFVESYDDFTSSWYAEHGSSIVFASYLRCLVALFELFKYYFKNRFWQFYDRGFTSDRNKTKQISFEAYKKIYSNDHFEIQRSYADILNIIFFTMMYWVILPHLFFTGLLNLILILIKDRILSKKQHLNLIRFHYLSCPIHV